MSHFTVLVTGDDIDGQLAAYDQNLETEARHEHLAARGPLSMSCPMVGIFPAQRPP
jgi:hypothetical protein